MRVSTVPLVNAVPLHLSTVIFITHTHTFKEVRQKQEKNWLSFSDNWTGDI